MSVSSIATLSRAMSSPDLHHPSAWANPALRASDADRERAADALRRHHLDGRLDTDELQERLGRCYAARTTGELAALFADLPAGGGGRPGPPLGCGPRAAGRRGARGRPRARRAVGRAPRPSGAV